MEKEKDKKMKHKHHYNVGKNNPFFGKKHSRHTRYIIRKKKLNENNPNWKGNNVGYEAVHGWIKRRLKKPKLCQQCKDRPVMDLSNISGKYLRQFNDWQWLCRRCHMLSDDRMSNLNRGITDNVGRDPKTGMFVSGGRRK